MPRIFIVDERQIPDPDPKLSIEQVRDSLAEFFPELQNATHTLVQRGEDQVVDFTKRVGTKGFDKEERHRQLEEALRGAEAALAEVSEAARSEKSGGPCRVHYNVCTQSVGGNPFRDEMLLLFPDEINQRFGLHGYQTYQCLACGEFSLRRYDGTLIGPISPEQEARWSFRDPR